MFILLTAGQYEKHTIICCAKMEIISFIYRGDQPCEAAWNVAQGKSGGRIALDVAGSIPTIPFPVNCHYRKAFPKCSHLPSDWFRWFTLGDNAWFKSTHRTFLFLR